MEPIGYIESCYKDRFGTPRQAPLVPSSWAILRLRPELNLQDALDGLEEFSHLWLIFLFHRNENKGIKTKIHPPRMQGEKIGLFATRTPHRPNPLGLSAVKLEKIEGNALYLSGVDLIDGTPILDIKPYVREVDSIPDAVEGWTSGRAQRPLQVTFAETALQDLIKIAHVEERSEKLRNLIRETLELDPRPNFYKGTPEKENPYTDIYGFRVEEFNVVYKMEGVQATVLNVEVWSTPQV